MSQSKKSYFLQILAVAAISLFVVLPTLIGVFHKIPGKTFTGNTFYFDPWDVNVYVSAVNYSQKFGFDFENMYTTENFPNRVNLYPLYSLTGTLFKNINPFLVYYLLIISAIYVFVLVVGKTIKFVIPVPLNRFYFIILLSLSGGFGWLLFGNIPSADITTTPFTFLNMLQRPHATAAISFYIASLISFYRFSQTKAKKYLTLSIISLFVFAIFYPYLLLSFYATIFIYSLFLYHTEKNTLGIKTVLKIFFLTLIPAAIYSLYILKGSQFKGVLSPNLPTPQILYIFLGHGVFLTGLIYQIFNKKRSNLSTFLIIWYLSGILLSYAPISFSRYYLSSLFFPITLLLYISKKDLLKMIKSIHLRTTLVVIFIFFGTLTSWVILFVRILAVSMSSRWAYLDESYFDIFKFLNRNSPSGSGVMVTYPISNFIPVYTYNKVYLGHGAQTFNAVEKDALQKRFYDLTISEDGLNSIIKSNVRYAVVENNSVDMYLNLNSQTTKIGSVYQSGNYTLLEFR